MNKLNPALAAIFFAAALGACDRRDSEDDQSRTPSDSGMPNAAASADGTIPDATATGSMASNGAKPTPDSMGANGAASAGPTPTLGETPMPGTPTAAGSADADFYRKALGSGTGEVALSEHAARTSSSTEVKRIADMLVADHRALNGKLGAASGMGEVQPPPADVKAAEDIKSKTSAAFDTAYLQKMSDGHKKSIALYETASNGASDAETRRLASAALPKLREHAGHIEKALATVGKNR